MGYVKAYSWDVFISYTHDDNELTGQRANWVSIFQENLAKEIKGLLGSPVNVQFDVRDQKYNEKIELVLEKARRSAVFLAIGSPSYTTHNWCQREAEAFRELDKDGERMFVAEFIPLRDNMAYPDSLPDVRRAFFWSEDRVTLQKRSLVHRSVQYEKTLAKLADDIATCLQSLHDETGGEPPPPPVVPGRAVYIAYSADDVGDKREELKAYLSNVGIRVLPDPFRRPGSTERFLEAVEAGLDSASIYVQLLGQRPSQPIEDLEEGETYHQYAQAEKRPHLDQFLWRPETVSPAAIEDRRYRNLLENENVKAWGIIEFAKTIIAAVTKVDPPPPSSGPVIFISANRVDENYADDVFDACVRRDLDVSRASQLEPEELRERFASADTVTFIYGNAEERWLDKQHGIFLKARAERSAPFGRLPLIVCVGPPVERGKRLPFHLRGMREVDVRDHWSVEPFERVLDEMSPQ